MGRPIEVSGVLPLAPERHAGDELLGWLVQAAAEIVLLDESHQILDRSLALRIRLVEHPQPDVLFDEERLEFPCLYDLPQDFGGHQTTVLVDHQLPAASPR